MKRFNLVAIVLAMTFSIATPVNAQNKSFIGLLLGAAGGGFAGSHIGSGSGRLAATALGTLLGAGIGQSIGQSLDRADSLSYSNNNQQVFNRRVFSNNNIPRPYAYRQASQRRFQTTQRVTQRRFRSDCRSGVIREYQTVVVIAGRERPAWGRACYMQDGSWRKL